MMLNATEENRKALASLLGIDEEEAAEKLQTRVTVTVGDPAGAAGRGAAFHRPRG